ncbi:MAG: AEC family transporter [Motiliproteus sp.]
MLTVIEIILPVFGLILLGYALGKAGFFSQSGINEISRFIFYLAIPALIFRTAAKGLGTQTLELSILLAFFGANLLIFLLCLILSPKLLRLTKIDATVFSTGATYSNLVLIGLPIVQARFGDEGLVALMTIISINALILFTLPCTLIELGQQQQPSLLKSLRTVMISVIRNPMILAIGCGFGWGIWGQELPYIVDKFTGLLGQAAAPCALFTVGASLSQYTLKGNLVESISITLLKLLVAPLLVWTIGHFLLDLSPVWLSVATLSAGLPVAANVFILSQRYNSYTHTTSSSILLSTFISMLTLSLMLVGMSSI